MFEHGPVVRAGDTMGIEDGVFLRFAEPPATQDFPGDRDRTLVLTLDPDRDQ